MAEHKQDILFDAEHEIIPVKSAKDYRRAITNSAALAHEIAEIMMSGGGFEGEFDALNSIADKQDAQLKAFRESVNVYDPKYLSDNLIKLADDCGLRISDLDDILGLSNGYIARTLKPESKKRLSIDVVRNLAELFKVNVDDLINRPLFEPTPDLRLVLEFLERLKERIDSGVDKWRKTDSPEREYDALFTGLDGNHELRYKFLLPYSEPYYEVEDVYYAKTGNEGLYIVYLQSKKGADRYNIIRAISKCYDTDGRMYPSEKMENDFITIMCDTSTDSSGILKQTIKSVVNAICSHLRDYTVSGETRNFMAAFIKETDDLTASRCLNKGGG